MDQISSRATCSNHPEQLGATGNTCSEQLGATDNTCLEQGQLLAKGSFNGISVKNSPPQGKTISDQPPPYSFIDPLLIQPSAPPLMPSAPSINSATDNIPLMPSAPPAEHNEDTNETRVVVRPELDNSNDARISGTSWGGRCVTKTCVLRTAGAAAITGSIALAIYFLRNSGTSSNNLAIGTSAPTIGKTIATICNSARTSLANTTINSLDKQTAQTLDAMEMVKQKFPFLLEDSDFVTSNDKAQIDYQNHVKEIRLNLINIITDEVNYQVATITSSRAYDTIKDEEYFLVFSPGTLKDLLSNTWNVQKLAQSLDSPLVLKNELTSDIALKTFDEICASSQWQDETAISNTDFIKSFFTSASITQDYYSDDMKTLTTAKNSFIDNSVQFPAAALMNFERWMDRNDYKNSRPNLVSMLASGAYMNKQYDWTSENTKYERYIFTAKNKLSLLKLYEEQISDKEKSQKIAETRIKLTSMIRKCEKEMAKTAITAEHLTKWPRSIFAPSSTDMKRFLKFLSDNCLRFYFNRICSDYSSSELYEGFKEYITTDQAFTEKMREYPTYKLTVKERENLKKSMEQLKSVTDEAEELIIYTPSRWKRFISELKNKFVK